MKLTPLQKTQMARCQARYPESSREDLELMVMTPGQRRWWFAKQVAAAVLFAAVFIGLRILL